MALSGPMLGAVIFASTVVGLSLIAVVYIIISNRKGAAILNPHKSATSITPVNRYTGTPTPYTQAGYPTSINPTNRSLVSRVKRFLRRSPKSVTPNRASAGYGSSTAAHLVRDP